MESENEAERPATEGTSTRLAYFLIGGGIGAIVALLFAPKAGRELRGDITEEARRGVDRTREAAGQLAERARTSYQTMRDRSSDQGTAVTGSSAVSTAASSAEESWQDTGGES